MKLNKKSKDVIRKEIEEMLKDVPEEKRIKLDKEVLEDLLFETDYNKKHNINLKFIVWHGDFLSKIDLSEISFDNICLDINYFDNNFKKEMTNPVNHYEGMEEINLSNTNISFDFSKLHNDSKYIRLSNVNFENVDLSNCDTSNVRFLKNVNLSGTNIKFMQRNKQPTLLFENVNLCGVDLSNFNIDSRNFAKYYTDKYDTFLSCNFKNTKINIDFNTKTKYSYMDSSRRNKAYNNFYSMLNEGKLEGCCLNGKLVKPIKRTDEERQLNKERILAEYAEFDKRTYDEIIGNVAEEVKKSRK